MATAAEQIPFRKKKILILISQGGGGHIAAGESLKEILGDEFDVSISNVLTEILQKLDPLHRLTCGKCSGEELYNYFLKRHKNRFIRWIAAYGTRHISAKSIEKLFLRYLEEASAPDLIISHTPFINYGVLLAAEKKNIPLIVVPTDLDGSTFLQGFPKKAFSKHLTVALAYDDPEIFAATFKNTSLSEQSIAIAGFPVRPAALRAYDAKDIAALRRKHNMLEGHRTATLLMGALGGNLIVEHVKTLSLFDPRPHHLKLEVNVCTGSNQGAIEAISRHLKAIGGTLCQESSYRLENGLVFHIRGFTKDILEIMAASDLIITKTGSCTVNEAIYLQKPLLLDNTARSTARHLKWEQFNIPFVQRHRLGASFTNARQLHMLIPSMLKFPDDAKSRPFDLPPFEENIRKIVKKNLSCL